MKGDINLSVGIIHPTGQHIALQHSPVVQGRTVCLIIAARANTKGKVCNSTSRGKRKGFAELISLTNISE